MLKLLLALHLLFAVFAVGPLVHAATTSGPGARKGDPAARAAASRVLRIYSYASVLVVLAGLGLMSQKRQGAKLGEIGDTWIWLSIVLWAVCAVLVVVVPAAILAKDNTPLAQH